MIPLIVPIGALLAGVALLLLGSGLLNTLLALRGEMEGYSDSTLGFVMSGYFVGFFVGTFLALPIIRRIGHIRTFALFAALASCSALLHSLFINPYAWLLLRIMTGTAFVVLYTVIESWLNGQTPSHQRGRVFAVYMIVNLVALALAQQLLQIDSPYTFTLFAISAILISLSLIPITWTRFPQPEVSDVARLSLKQLHNAAPVAVMGALFSGLAMGAFWGLGALYGRRIGLESNTIAHFISCAIIGGAIFQFPLGRYSDTHDRRKVLAFVCGFAALAGLLLIALSTAGLWILLAITFYGGFAFALYPITVAHLIDHLEQSDILAGGSALLLIHGVGAAFGPVLAGQLMTLFGPQALPVFFVVMQTLLALYCISQMKVLKKDDLEHASQFMPMLRTTPSVLEMHPEDEPTVHSEQKPQN